MSLCSLLSTSQFPSADIATFIPRKHSQHPPKNHPNFFSFKISKSAPATLQLLIT